MAIPIPYGPDRCVSLPDHDALSVEVVEEHADAAAEGYITAMTTTGPVTHVELILDHGPRAAAMLSADDAAWLGLEVGQIVAVRLHRWLDF